MGALKGGSCPHLAKPHLAKKIRIWPGHFRDRIWPNRIWPELVFQSVDRIWPNRIWPELVFLVFWSCVCVSRFWVCSRLCVLCVFNCVCLCFCVCCVCSVCSVCCVWCVVCLVGVFKMFGGCLQDVWWVSSRCLVGVVGVFKIFGASPLDGPLRRTAQNFALFFLSPAGNFILSSLSGGSSR